MINVKEMTDLELLSISSKNHTDIGKKLLVNAEIKRRQQKSKVTPIFRYKD